MIKALIIVWKESEESARVAGFNSEPAARKQFNVWCRNSADHNIDLFIAQFKYPKKGKRKLSGYRLLNSHTGKDKVVLSGDGAKVVSSEQRMG